MWFDNPYNFTVWDLIKAILAGLAILLMIAEISAGTSLLNANQDKGKTMTDADYAQLTVNDEINGEIKDVIMKYSTSVEGSESLAGYLVMYDNDVIVPFVVNTDNQLAEKMDNLCNKVSNQPIRYRGRVHKLTDMEATVINMTRIADNVKGQYKIKGRWQEHLTRASIHATYDTATVNEKYIVSSFIGAALMVLLTAFLLKKSFGKLVYKFRCTFGHYKEKPQITNDDIEVDMGVYDGSVTQNGNFYFDTEYDFEKKNSELTAARLERERIAREAEIEKNKNILDKMLDNIPTLNPTEEPPPQKSIFDSDSFYTGGASEDGFFNESITQEKDPNDDRNTRIY